MALPILAFALLLAFQRTSIATIALVIFVLSILAVVYIG